MKIKEELESLGRDHGVLHFHEIEVEPEKILAVMINEVVPANPADDFYGGPEAAYLTTTIPLFQAAGIPVNSVQEILDKGIYITNAVKRPKSEYTIEKSSLEESVPYLERELSLFPNVKVIMLMGDVAKKCFNQIAKKNTGKPAVPAVSTYKLRNSETIYNGIRIMPSYIMTGQNLLIEKSKFQMASEDIAIMCQLIGANENRS